MPPALSTLPFRIPGERMEQGHTGWMGWVRNRHHDAAQGWCCVTSPSPGDGQPYLAAPLESRLGNCTSTPSNSALHAGYRLQPPQPPAL